MIVIRGNTFQYRDRLKNSAGRWNPDAKQWEFSSMSPGEITDWSHRPGIIIEESGEPQTPVHQTVRHRTFAQFNQQTIERTNFFGDDKTYFNYFADQNPTTFFGFSGLNMLMGFVDHMPPHVVNDSTNDRNSPYVETRPHWYASNDMQHALSIARNGWPEGTELADTFRAKMLGQHALERRRKYSVAGGRVSIGKLLADNPKHMINRPKQPGKKVVTLFLESSFSASINSDHIILRAGIVAAVCDILELNGYSCEIVAVACAKHYSRPAWQLTTTVKKAGHTLNINDLVFSLGHTSYFRRFNLAAIGIDPDLHDVWKTAGQPSDPFRDDHPTKQNEFIIKQIKHKNCDDISDDAPMMTQAKQIWDLIVPDNFPITLKD